MLNLTIKDSFNKELPVDLVKDNTRRQVVEACFSFVKPKKTSNPKILHVSEDMASRLGFYEEKTSSEAFKNIFTGNEIYPNTNPYAMCYGGHQFGHWAGQLGDGRAINLFEVTHNKKNWALQLKGAGETPYSRTADGLAVLRSSIREYLCSEAMYYLGVPTTRALSLALSGDQVLRDVMYDGNPAYEKGAIVCRVAESFLRFGNYQIFTARGDLKTLKTLVDYTIKHHFKYLGEPSKNTYISFFKEVANRSLDMVIHWQRVGFVHGVMNTDNMSILGLTIDYGPYGWLEGYDHGWTPNTTDNTHKRYRYDSQPEIVLWNLYQLANALYPLIEEAEPLEAILESYQEEFPKKYLKMMHYKLGLFSPNEMDEKLIFNLEEVLHKTETDMTIFFRLLSSVSKNDTVKEAIRKIEKAFYTSSEVVGEIKKSWENWFQNYLDRLEKETVLDEERKAKMNTVNPKYVLRNYMAQLAIDDADKGNYALLNELYELLKKPYEEQPKYERWFAKRPEWARNKVGCSMLSCSS
ncbi:protein adenylyltransferase SelO [Tenacibaculum crassostreae]|uniref:protein adenylyltransferase SelO n=1 Tax=Tenacibaculum crassostreae TaxID=502683 RepID=UPI0038939E2A